MSATTTKRTKKPAAKKKSTTAKAVSAALTTIALAALPRIGADLAGGKFAGIVGAEKAGDPDIALVDLGFSEKEMTHAEAEAFAKERDGVRPTRVEARVLWANIDSRASMPYAWFWCEETVAGDESFAWCQDFSTGYQGSGHKSDRYRARAVRRVLITSSI